MSDSKQQHLPRLTRAQVEQQVNRLTYRPEPKPIRDPFPVCPSAKLSKEEIDHVTQRVYYQYCQRHEEALREAAAKQEKELRIVLNTMPKDELDESVKRLYYDSIERKKANRRDAEERLLFKSAKEIPKVPLKKFVEDMYMRGIQREKEKEQKLYEKYILPTDIKTTRISRSQAEASGARLCTKSGGD